MPRTKINLSVNDLLAELRRRQKNLPRLRKLAARLEKKLASVREEIAALGGQVFSAVSTGKLVQKSGPKSAAKQAGGRKRPRNKMNLADALVSVLEKDKPKSVKTLIADVKAAGYKTTSANFDTIVYQTLSRQKNRIVKVGRGLYKLKS